MELAIFVAIAFLASCFQGITGFGSALIASPLALLFVDKHVAIQSFIVIGFATNISLILEIRKPVGIGKMKYAMIGGLLGLPVGLALLNYLSSGSLAILAGAMTMVFSTVMFGGRLILHRSRIVEAVMGFMAGILQLSVGMSGPPLVLLLLGFGIHRDEFRKVLAELFLILNVVSILYLLYSGQLKPGNMMFGVYSLPLVLLGTYLGNLISERIPESRFGRVVYLTLLTTGVVAIFTSII